MHILITGAAGMIGRKLTDAAGHRPGARRPADRKTDLDRHRRAGATGGLFRSRQDPRRRSRRAGRRGKSDRGAAGGDLPSRRRGVGRGGDRFREGLSRQSRRHPRAARSHPRRRRAATSRNSCSPRRSRSSARRSRKRSPTTSISRRSPPTARRRRSANCCSPTTPGAAFSTASASGCRRSCVRPGKPNKAASGFFSGIIREPLAGQEAVLPVADSVLHTHASPRSAVGFLIHAAGLTREQFGPRINLTMPGVCCTVGEQIEALERIAGDKVAARIRRAPDELVERIVAGWPQRFDARRALALGFKAEATFDDIIRAHIEDELGGRIALIPRPLEPAPRLRRPPKPYIVRHDLRRRRRRPPPQDRPDQDPRPRRLRGHAQGRATGRALPRHADRACRARRADRNDRQAGVRLRAWITARCRRR